MSIAQSSLPIRSIRETSCWCWMAHDVFDRFGEALGWDGLGLYHALARHANNRTGQCWPSLGYLAAKTHSTEAEVAVLLQRLVDLRLITVQERPGRAPLMTMLALPEMPGAEAPPAPVIPPVEDVSRMRASEKEEKLEKEKKSNFVSCVSGEEGTEKKGTSFCIGGREKEKNTHDAPPACVPVSAVTPSPRASSQRPDDGLTALALAPELDARLEHAAIEAFAQEGKRLLRDGGWVTRGDVDSRKLALWETWQHEAAERQDAPCCTMRGCLHEHVHDAEVCHDCGALLAPVAASVYPYHQPGGPYVR